MLRRTLEHMPDLRKTIHPTGAGALGYGDRGIMARGESGEASPHPGQMLDENEFLSPVRNSALSRYHLDHPYMLICARPGVSGVLSAGRVG